MSAQKARQWADIRWSDTAPGNLVAVERGSGAKHPVRFLPRSDMSALAGIVGGYEGSIVGSTRDVLLQHVIRRCSHLGPERKSLLDYTDSATTTTTTTTGGTTVQDSTTTDSTGLNPSDLDVLRRLLGGGGISEDRVRTIMAEALAAHKFTPTVNVKVGDRPTVTITEHVNPAFEDVVTAVSAGEHVFLTGPAGTGKSTLMAQVIRSLGLQYRAYGCKPDTMAHHFLGWMNPVTSQFTSTTFVNHYLSTPGAGFGIDEIDAPLSPVLLSLNMVLANGYAELDDGRQVEVPAGNALLATGNTWGTGADAQYMGRSPIDAAALDRWTIIPVDYDTTYEHAACKSLLTADTAARWMDAVRVMRANVETHKLRCVISTRGVVGVAKLVKQGMTWEKAVRFRILKGTGEHDTGRILKDAKVPTGTKG